MWIWISLLYRGSTEDITHCLTNVFRIDHRCRGDGASVVAGNGMTSGPGERRAPARTAWQWTSPLLQLCFQLCFQLCCHLWSFVFTLGPLFSPLVFDMTFSPLFSTLDQAQFVRKGQVHIFEMTLVSDCCVLINWVCTVGLFPIFTCKKIGKATFDTIWIMTAIQRIWCCHSDVKWFSM